MNATTLYKAFDDEHLIVCLDIEATCCNDNSFPRHEMEIIELGVAVFNPNDLDVPPITWYSFVKPTIHPTLTDFCKELTGITQEQVDAADSWEEVSASLQSFLSSLGVEYPTVWASWGDFDRNKIARECETKNVVNPLPVQHINLKDADFDLCGRDRQIGLGLALRERKLPFPGKQHRAVCDAIAVQMVTKHLYMGYLA